MELRLNLGSNDRRFPGYASVDIAPPADILADLTKPWPWEDSSVAAVKAFHIFEHLPDSMNTMNELWRVCKPGAIIEMEVPNAAHGAGAFQDPTHKSFWTMNTFWYFADGTPHRERLGKAYGIKARFRVLDLRERPGKDKLPEPVWIICANLEVIK
jgi:SAM-dependent methyltransferase